METANRAAEEVNRLASDLVIEPEAVAVIVRDEKGRFKVTTNHRPVAAGFTWGMPWGALFGLLFFVPIFNLAIGGAFGALFGALGKGRRGAAARGPRGHRDARAGSCRGGILTA